MDPLRDPQHPHRPQHPDFWRLSEIITELDGMATEGGKDVGEITGQHVDGQSISYMALMRAIRIEELIGHPPNKAQQAGLWLDGFLTGTTFVKRGGRQSDPPADRAAQLEQIARDLDPEAFDQYPNEEAQRAARRWARRVIKAGFVKP